MANIYEPSPEMQDIYDKDKEENQETDELIRQGKLKEAAKKKKELKTNLFRSIAGGAYEIGAGIGFDVLTAPLAWTGPVYAAANFGEGAISNIIGQLIRGEEFNWSEVASSGALGVVPLTSLRAAKYLKRPAARTVENVIGKGGTLKRVATSGAITGVADQTIQAGLGEQRLPTTEEVVGGALTGGVVGTGFKAVPGTIDLAKRLQQQINEATGTVRTAFAGGLDVGTARDVSGGAGAAKGPSRRRGILFYDKTQRRLTEPVNIEEVKKLQSKYGGSDEQVKEFITANKKAEHDVKAVIDLLNDYSLRDIASSRVLDEAGVRLTEKQRKGIEKQVTRIKGDLYSLGHIRAVRNLWLAGDSGANRITNMEPEMWHNLEQVILDEFGQVQGTKIIELGNSARKHLKDKPDLINLVEGVSRTLDEEYLKFIDPEITDFFDFLPREFYPQFEESIKESMRLKRRFSKKTDVIDKQQKDLNRKWLRESIDEYLAGMDNQGLGTLMNSLRQAGMQTPSWMKKVNEKLNPPKKKPKKKLRKKKP